MPIDKNGISNGVKTKNLIIIFILFLIITLISAVVVFLTADKAEPILTPEPISLIEQIEKNKKENGLNQEPAVEIKPVVRQEPVMPTKAPEIKTDESVAGVFVSMVISGTRYEVGIPAGNSVYDLMDKLKQEKKIDFQGKDYSGMGFFVEEINGVRNDLSGRNWVYYINGQPAQVGISYYKLKNNDVIEWKYENKSF